MPKGRTSMGGNNLCRKGGSHLPGEKPPGVKGMDRRKKCFPHTRWTGRKKQRRLKGNPPEEGEEKRVKVTEIERKVKIIPKPQEAKEDRSPPKGRKTCQKKGEKIHRTSPAQVAGIPGGNRQEGGK